MIFWCYIERKKKKKKYLSLYIYMFGKIGKHVKRNKEKPSGQPYSIQEVNLSG